MTIGIGHQWKTPVFPPSDMRDVFLHVKSSNGKTVSAIGFFKQGKWWDSAEGFEYPSSTILGWDEVYGEE